MPDKHCWQTSHTQAANYAQMAENLTVEIKNYENILERFSKLKHLGAQQAQNKAEFEEMLGEMRMRRNFCLKKASERDET